MSRGILGRFNDFAKAVVLIATGIALLWFLDGVVSMTGPAVAATGCVFLLLSVTD